MGVQRPIVLRSLLVASCCNVRFESFMLSFEFIYGDVIHATCEALTNNGSRVLLLEDSNNITRKVPILLVEITAPPPSLLKDIWIFEHSTHPMDRQQRPLI